MRICELICAIIPVLFIADLAAMDSSGNSDEIDPLALTAIAARTHSTKLNMRRIVRTSFSFHEARSSGTCSACSAVETEEQEVERRKISWSAPTITRPFQFHPKRYHHGCYACTKPEVSQSNGFLHEISCSNKGLLLLSPVSITLQDGKGASFDDSNGHSW